jgi:inosine/xanthosine triphosphatase
MIFYSSPGCQTMRVVLGGTFDPLHKGHRALFDRAFGIASGGHIIIGLTSDSMASDSRKRAVRSYSERKNDLEKYLKELVEEFPGTEFEIKEINEVYNKAITQEGKLPFKLEVVKYVLAEDGLPIKATRISSGEIDSEGKLLGLVTVAVGTNNDVKLSAVRNIFQRLHKSVELKKVPTSSGVSAQPWGSDTITGAKNRAAAALKAEPDAHFGVGIEAGLFRMEPIDEIFDVQYCAIQDRGGRITIGHGPGFYYPEKVITKVNQEKTVGEAMDELTGISEIGHKQGAIGYLTKNLLNREGLTEGAVIMAMVPRISELFE